MLGATSPSTNDTLEGSLFVSLLQHSIHLNNFTVHNDQTLAPAKAEGLVALQPGSASTQYLPTVASSLEFDEFTVRAIILDILGICVVVILLRMWHLWVERTNTPTSKADGKATLERSALLDNAKWVASAFVIYNHCMYEAALQVYTPVAPLSLVVNKALSFVVNPMFVFVSGVTSQGAPTVRRVRRYVQFLIVPTLMWHFFVWPVIMPALKMGNPTVLWHRLQPESLWQTLKDQTQRVPEWYLSALVIWRGASYVVWSHIPKPVAFMCMFALSFYGGYFELPQNLNPVFSYMPVFGLGFAFPFTAVQGAIAKPNCVASGIVVVMALVYAFIVMPMYFPTVPGSNEWTGVLPDAHGWYGEGNTLFQSAASWDYRLWWCRRLAKLFADMVIPLAIIFLVLPREQVMLTYAGSHTLYSYLLQTVFLSWRVPVIDILRSRQLTFLTGTDSHVQLAKVLLYIPFSLVVFVVVTSQYWRFFFKWALTPTWLDSIFDIAERRTSEAMGTERTDDKYPSEVNDRITTPGVHGSELK